MSWRHFQLWSWTYKLNLINVTNLTLSLKKLKASKETSGLIKDLIPSLRGSSIDDVLTQPAPRAVQEGGQRISSQQVVWGSQHTNNSLFCCGNLLKTFTEIYKETGLCFSWVSCVDAQKSLWVLSSHFSHFNPRHHNQIPHHPSGPCLVVPNPHLLFQEPCSFSFGILFPKRELHFCTCAALSAESATPASSQQTTSFKGWFQTFPTLRHKRLFGHSVKHYKKLKDQTHSSEPSIVTRKEIWSLVHWMECKCSSSF